MKRFFLSVATSAVLLSALPALAQPTPGTAPPPPPPIGEPLAGPAHGPAGRGMQHRLQAFHDRLGITPAQQPQWDAVIAALRENAQAMRESPDRAAFRRGEVHGVAALQAAAEMARQRADGMQHLIPAVQSLYGVLSPEQRQTADHEIDRLVHVGRGGHPRG